MRLLLLCALFSLVALASAQVSLETRTINSSLYYVTHNNGGISNWTYSNYTQGKFATTEGQGDAEAAYRMTQYNFTYLVVTLNANNTINRLITTDWAQFVTGGISDNATYWKTWAGRQWNADAINFTDSQQETDSYILETLAFDGNENFPRDVWVAVKFDSSFFNNVGYATDVRMSNCLMNSTTPCIATNWTYLALTRLENGWGWEFHNVSDRARMLVVYNNTAWMLWFLGRRINGHVEFSYARIDVNPCTSTCDSGDGVSLSYADSTFANVQCGYGINNETAEVSWTDSFGTCSLSNCALGPVISNPYNNTLGGLINVDGAWNTSNISAAQKANWMTCVMDGAQGSNCTFGNHFIAAKDMPTKGYLYDFYVTMAGKYNIALFSHTMKACLFTDSGEYTQACAYATSPNVIPGTDTTAPNVSINFVNASNNTIYSTNGSLRYANWTPVFTFSDTGLVNNSCFLFSNWSGSWNCKDLQDFWTASNSSIVLVNTSAWYRLMVRANDTNKNSNLTQYVVAFNIIPVPSNTPTPIATLDNTQIDLTINDNKNNFWLLTLVLLGGFIYWQMFLYKKREPKSNQ